MILKDQLVYKNKSVTIQSNSKKFYPAGLQIRGIEGTLGEVFRGHFELCEFSDSSCYQLQNVCSHATPSESQQRCFEYSL